MGQARNRKAEIDRLKGASPAEAARLLDERKLARGIDLSRPDPEPVAAMARALHFMFEQSKQDGNVDKPVQFLHSKVDATVNGFGSLPIACKRGCSHCCNIWVSVTAPEALSLAKIVKSRGQLVVDRVRAVYEHTKGYSFDTRDQHPTPCPLLEQDVCSVYSQRPKSCRLAASADAAICARAYHNITNEDIPTPMLYLMARGAYAVAMACALRRSNLPHYAYEMNAALVRALDVTDGERAWLSGEDIFANVMRDPEDVFSAEPAQIMYDHAFAARDNAK